MTYETYVGIIVLVTILCLPVIIGLISALGMLIKDKILEHRRKKYKADPFLIQLDLLIDKQDKIVIKLNKLSREYNKLIEELKEKTLYCSDEELTDLKQRVKTIKQEIAPLEHELNISCEDCKQYKETNIKKMKYYFWY